MYIQKNHISKHNSKQRACNNSEHFAFANNKKTVRGILLEKCQYVGWMNGEKFKIRSNIQNKK